MHNKPPEQSCLPLLRGVIGSDGVQRRIQFIALFLIVPTVAFAARGHHQRTPAPTPTPPPTGEITFEAWTTAYTYWDNTPPGSAEISNPVLHSNAGGTGTYADPITIAVGDSGSKLDYPAGTRFYLPHLEKFFIVEDTCANCHAGHSGYPHLDMWIGGQSVSASKADQCAYAITDIHTIIENPSPNHVVYPGAVIDSGCKQFGA
jgi:hypothetical protein